MSTAWRLWLHSGHSDACPAVPPCGHHRGCHCPGHPGRCPIPPLFSILQRYVGGKYCFQKNCVQWGLSFVPPGAPLRQPFFPRVSSRRPSKVYPSDPSLLVMQTGLSSTNPELRFAGFLLIPQCSLALSHSLCSLCHCLLGLSFRGHWKPCTAFRRLGL